jgi:hypothetical protein
MQPLIDLNPVKHLAVLARGVMLKGVGLEVLYPNFLALVAFTIVLVGAINFTLPIRSPAAPSTTLLYLTFCGFRFDIRWSSDSLKSDVSIYCDSTPGYLFTCSLSMTSTRPP